MRALCLALLVACYQPSPADCSYACPANGPCPSGLECRDNVCRDPNITSPCSTPMPDAATCMNCAETDPCFEGVCGGARVRELAAGGEFACALLNSGSVWCWGANEYKQLGNNTNVVDCGGKPCRHAPAKVMGLPRKAINLVAGRWAACAILDDNSAWCWGRSELRALGFDPMGDEECFPMQHCTATPRQIPGLGAVAELSLSEFAGCARVGGDVFCWGLNKHGNLGNGTLGTEANPSPPTQVQISDVANIAVSGHYDVHACAIKNDGTVWCWGNNLYGSTGQAIGTNACNSGYPCTRTPAQVTSVTAARDLLVGAHVTCAATTMVSMYCWGSCGDGLTGDAQCASHPDGNTLLTAPTLFSSVPTGGFLALSGNYSHACAVQGNGISTAWCWGQGNVGQLGDGIVAAAELCGQTPCRRTAAPTIPQIKGRVFAGHGGFSLAVDQSNVAWGWGANSYGQAGHPPHASVDQSCTNGLCNPTPTPIEGLPSAM